MTLPPNGVRRSTVVLAAAPAVLGVLGGVVLLVVDPVKQRRHELDPLIEALGHRSERKILVLNKVDVAKKEPLLALAQEFGAKADFAEIFFVSAQTGDGVPELKTALASMMPEGEWIYPEDQVSDASERLMAAEITREKIFERLHQELPYHSTVEPDSWEERPDGSVRIEQTIFVERDSQRMIVLGKGGQTIKAIGQSSRRDIAEAAEKPVHLFLHVKTRENWADDPARYRAMGLDFPKG